MWPHTGEHKLELNVSLTNVNQQCLPRRQKISMLSLWGFLSELPCNAFVAAVITQNKIPQAVNNLPHNLGKSLLQCHDIAAESGSCHHVSSIAYGKA